MALVSSAESFGCVARDTTREDVGWVFIDFWQAGQTGRSVAGRGDLIDGGHLVSTIKHRPEILDP